MSEPHYLKSAPCECEAVSDVKNSRPAYGQPKMVRRRRQCRGCGHRWTIFEISARDYDATLVRTSAPAIRLVAGEMRALADTLDGGEAR